MENTFATCDKYIIILDSSVVVIESWVPGMDINLSSVGDENLSHGYLKLVSNFKILDRR